MGGLRGRARSPVRVRVRSFRCWRSPHLPPRGSCTIRAGPGPAGLPVECREKLGWAHISSRLVCWAELQGRCRGCRCRSVNEKSGPPGALGGRVHRVASVWPRTTAGSEDRCQQRHGHVHRRVAPGPWHGFPRELYVTVRPRAQTAWQFQERSAFHRPIRSCRCDGIARPKGYTGGQTSVSGRASAPTRPPPPGRTRPPRRGRDEEQAEVACLGCWAGERSAFGPPAEAGVSNSPTGDHRIRYAQSILPLRWVSLTPSGVLRGILA